MIRMTDVAPSINDKQKVKLIAGLRLVLCLTFIGSGVALIYNVYMGAMLPTLTERFQQGSLAISDMFKVAIEDSLDVPGYCYFLNAVLSLGSIVGGVMMWRGRRTGFYFYASAQLMTILVSVLLVGRSNTQLGNVMMTILFVAYYFWAMIRLGKEKKSVDQDNFPEVAEK